MRSLLRRPSPVLDIPDHNRTGCKKTEFSLKLVERRSRKPPRSGGL